MALRAGAERDGLSTRRGRSFLWGYGHYGIFAALAALGAGLEVTVRQAEAHDALTAPATGYAVTIPTAVFLVLLGVSHFPIVPRSRVRPSVLLGTAALVLLTPAASARAGVGVTVAVVALDAAAAGGGAGRRMTPTGLATRSTSPPCTRPSRAGADRRRGAGRPRFGATS